MGRKKVRVVRLNEERLEDPDRLTSWQLRTGETVEVGETVLILYHSTERWQEATVKRITESSGVATFHFHIPVPGSISILENRVKKIKKKQGRIKKTK